PEELLRGGPRKPARAGPLAGERSDGVPARSAVVREDPRQPAGRGQEREAPALREPAGRPGPAGPLRVALPAGPPLSPRGDRLDGGPLGRLGRGRQILLPHLLR